MTDNFKVKINESVNDTRMGAHCVSEDEKTGGEIPDSIKPKVEPHNRDQDVTISIKQKKITCPKCGELTIHVEFPDQYEAWIKCSSCNFFMGMSKAEWHLMENSSNINEKIKKMAKKRN
jgi:predicted RNA-binding Zn-ribbon protein involved in translation (DUF1610 family)